MRHDHIVCSTVHSHSFKFYVKPTIIMICTYVEMNGKNHTTLLPQVLHNLVHFSFIYRMTPNKMSEFRNTNFPRNYISLRWSPKNLKMKLNPEEVFRFFEEQKFARNLLKYDRHIQININRVISSCKMLKRSI